MRNLLIEKPTSKPAPKPTPEQLAKRAIRRANIATAIAIVAILLIGGTFGMSLGYGISYGNLIQQNAITANSQNQMLRAEMYDALMNVSSAYTTTIVQNGTFEWISAPSTTPLQTANYTLKYIQIGPLGFNVLVLNPPPVPLNIITGPGWYFRIQNFSPIVNQLLLLEQGDVTIPAVGPSLLRMTSSNAKKMQITGGCLNNTYTGIGVIPSGACIVSGTAGDYGVTPGINALRIDSSSFNVASTYSLYAIVASNPSSVVANQNFTLSSAWEFVLPSA